MAKRVRHTIGTRRVRVDNAPVAETAQPCGIERTGATGSATRPHRHDHGEGVGYMLVSSVSRVRACARERVVGVRDGAGPSQGPAAAMTARGCGYRGGTDPQSRVSLRIADG